MTPSLAHLSLRHTFSAVCVLEFIPSHRFRRLGSIANSISNIIAMFSDIGCSVSNIITMLGDIGCSIDNIIAMLCNVTGNA